MPEKNACQTADVFVKNALGGQDQWSAANLNFAKKKPPLPTGVVMRTYSLSIVDSFSPALFDQAIESVCDPALAAELSKNFFDGLQYVVDRSQITDGEIVVGLHQGSPTNVKFHPRYDYAVVSDKRFDGAEARARMRRQFELLDTAADSPELSQFGLFIRELCLPFSRLWKLKYGEIRVTVEQGKVTKVMIGYSFLVSEANMPKMGDAIFLQAAS